MNALRLLAIIEAHSITGPAKNLLEFAGLAKAQGVETVIATFTRRGTEQNLFLDTVRQRGIRLEVIAERRSWDPAVLPALRRLAERTEADVIQTHAVKSHLLARLADLPRYAPWVAFHHGYTWPTPIVRAYNQLDRWSLRAAGRVLTVSRPFRDELMAQGVRGEKIEIIHNAISPEWGLAARQPETAGALRRQLGISASSRVILIVGRLSSEKDHVVLLEAVSRLGRFEPHLLVVGDGPERPRIEEHISRLNLAGSVTLAGQQNSAEPYYGIADVAVLSSRTEGSPNALLEAMAAGVPVVATRVGGIPEIVEHEQSALLVEPGDREGMAAAIARVLEDRDLARRIVSSSRELIRSRHAPGERVRRLVRIYEEVREARCAR